MCFSPSRTLFAHMGNQHNTMTQQKNTPEHAALGAHAAAASLAALLLARLACE